MKLELEIGVSREDFVSGEGGKVVTASHPSHSPSESVPSSGTITFAEASREGKRRMPVKEHDCAAH